MVGKDEVIVIFWICPTNLKSIVLDTIRSEKCVGFVAFIQIIIVIYAVNYGYASRRDAMSAIIPSIEISK